MKWPHKLFISTKVFNPWIVEKEQPLSIVCYPQGYRENTYSFFMISKTFINLIMLQRVLLIFFLL
jgi:hypothetical protein